MSQPPRNPIINGLKICNHCGVAKPEDQYYHPMHQGKRRILGACKICVTGNGQRRLAAPDNVAGRARYAAYQKNYRQRVKDAVFAFYGGYRCNCCGDTEPLFLEIDHVENDGNKHRLEMGGNHPRSNGSAKTYIWIIKHDFPSGFQILCANCNRGKSRNGGVCPHLTNSARGAVPTHDAAPSSGVKGAATLASVTSTVDNTSLPGASEKQQSLEVIDGQHVSHAYMGDSRGGARIH